MTQSKQTDLEENVCLSPVHYEASVERISTLTVNGHSHQAQAGRFKLDLTKLDLTKGKANWELDARCPDFNSRRTIASSHKDPAARGWKGRARVA